MFRQVTKWKYFIERVKHSHKNVKRMLEINVNLREGNISLRMCATSEDIKIISEMIATRIFSSC